MAKSRLPIEVVIREHYQDTDGEWLVEKGKVKEAKMLKQAVARIDTLVADVAYAKEPREQEHGELKDRLRKEERANADYCVRIKQLKNCIQTLMDEIDTRCQTMQWLNDALEESNEVADDANDVLNDTTWETK